MHICMTFALESSFLWKVSHFSFHFFFDLNLHNESSLLAVLRLFSKRAFKFTLLTSKLPAARFSPPFKVV